MAGRGHFLTGLVARCLLYGSTLCSPKTLFCVLAQMKGKALLSVCQNFGEMHPAEASAPPASAGLAQTFAAHNHRIRVLTRAIRSWRSPF